MSDVISRPRRRNGFLRVLGWPVSLVLIMATVAAGDAILQRTPGSEEVNRPFVHSGPIGQVVDGLSITATVHSVRGAKAIADPDGDLITTGGVFVVVKLTLTAKTETTHLLTQTVVSNGKTFELSGRVRQSLDLYSLQPGIPVRGEMAFELPSTAAAGSRLQLCPNYVLDGRNQTVTEVVLGIDQSDVDTWLAATSPLELDQAEVQP